MVPRDEFTNAGGPEGTNPALLDLRQAALLRGVRERCGLTRAVVADSLSWSVKRLTRLEAGAEVPTLEELLSLSKLYALEGLHQLDEIERRHRRPVRAPRGSR